MKKQRFSFVALPSKKRTWYKETAILTMERAAAGVLQAEIEEQLLLGREGLG